MPQEKPTQNSLSKPVEPVFLTLLDKIVHDSFKYGLNKYGTELHSFNGRSEVQDAAEELVSALRYVVQLDMRCRQLEELLQNWMDAPNDSSICIDCLKELTSEALDKE